MSTKVNISTLNKIRVMGAVYLLCFIIPTMNWMLIISTFVQSNFNLSVIIIDREALFRFNIFNQVITSVFTFLLGYFLYKSLKENHHEISLLAFVLKVVESIFFLIIAFIFFISLSLLKAGAIENSLVAELVTNYISYTAFPGLFSGMSMLLFLALIKQQNIFPKWIVVWGIISHVLVIFYDSSVILSIQGIANPLAQIAITGPVGMFQLSISLLLILIPNKIINTTKL
jgi:hypothetical protein